MAAEAQVEVIVAPGKELHLGAHKFVAGDRVRVAAAHAAELRQAGSVEPEPAPQLPLVAPAAEPHQPA